MKKIKDRSGLSLFELLIALIITAVLGLSIGTISLIGVRTSNRFETEMEIFADISYGFKLMQKQVREANASPDPIAQSGNWASARLLIDNITGNDSVFGLYNNAVTNSIDFVFVPDQADETVREVLFSVPDTEPPPNLTITRTGGRYTVRLQGEKNETPFDITTDVLKRRG